MDSVNVTPGVVADRVLILDQGMILAAIANAIANDAMRRAFIDQQSEAILRPLIAPEELPLARHLNASNSARGDSLQPARDDPPETRLPTLSQPRITATPGRLHLP